MSGRRGELVAADEPTVVAKSLLDPVVVENSQGNGRLPDPASADESDRSEVLGETDDLIDQLVASEECSWRWRRVFPKYARFECEMANPLAVQIADLVRV